jgi:predicted lipoprotein with Yx(FWY)xxD motif
LAIRSQAKEAEMLKRMLALCAGAVTVALVALPVNPASGTSPAGGSGRAVVAVENGPYGQVLVVGGKGAAGPYVKGSSLYFATIDPPAYVDDNHYQPGCTTTVVHTQSRGTLSCTGPETDRKADWPAFTTSGPPIAGRGVNASLLGEVKRPDLGTYQVTYDGRPLYLFDPGPNSFFGANFYETVEPLPPWHTAWFLMAPDGTPATGPANLETEAPQPGANYHATKLAVEMLPGVAPGGVAVSVYTFSSDQPNYSTCYGPCAADFIPVTTAGAPVAGSGVNAGAIGVINRFDGSEQVTYNGKPLYIYSQEEPLPGSHGPSTTGTAGNGKGVSAFGGQLRMVQP